MRDASAATVALESTLIAHGLPWPDNLETARASEAAVREAGAEPATIAVLGGSIRVGLDRRGTGAAGECRPGRSSRRAGATWRGRSRGGSTRRRRSGRRSGSPAGRASA